MPSSSSHSLSSSPSFSNKKKRAVVFSLGCSCNDSKSVSVSVSSPALAATTSGRTTNHILRCRHPSESSSFDTPTLSSTSTSSSQLYTHNDTDEDGNSFSGLLRQLSQLEQSVVALDSRRHVNPLQRDDTDTFFPSRECNEVGVDNQGRSSMSHMRSKSEGGGKLRKVGESVAVVKVSADPVADFRQSMLQMIVEKKIVNGEELRELLASFLALNSPCHHGLIVRAFSGIWNDIISTTRY